MPPRLLVADDQQDVLSAVRLALSREDLDVVTVSSPDGALAAVTGEQFDAVLMDLNYTRDTTSGTEGLELLGRLRQADPDVPVIVMTAWATVGIAVEAMRAGARDFLEKPWDNTRLLSIIRNQLALGRALRRSRQLEAENALLRGGAAEPTMIGASSAMQAVLGIARRVATADASVLITGENGTGKSSLARLIHEWSRRRERSLIEVNVGALPEGVFESEMFGHVRGAFTDARTERVGRFELADEGTLFLDEIGNLLPAQQAKLLRVLESGEFEVVGSSRTRKVDVRMISATNADLDALVRDGRFRPDLLFRMNTVEIRMPPLREHVEDVVPLALAALASFSEKHGCARGQRALRLRGFTPEAVHSLHAYSWPGNVRELRNVVERAVLLAPGEYIDTPDLRLNASDSRPPRLEQMSLEDAERALVHAALRRFEGNVAAAAEALGISRSGMYRRMEKLGIRAEGRIEE